MRGTQTKAAGHPAAALPADRDRGPVHVQGQEIRTRKGAASARRASRGRQVAVEARYDYVKLIAQPARTRIWSPARLLRCLVKTERWGLGTPTPSAKRRSGSMIEFGHQPAPLCRSSSERLGCCLERCPLADGRVAHGAGGACLRSVRGRLPSGDRTRLWTGAVAQSGGRTRHEVEEEDSEEGGVMGDRV